MPHFNPVELIIVLLIVLVLFGAGRVSKLGGELGSAVREFRKALNGEEQTKTDQANQTTQPTAETKES